MKLDFDFKEDKIDSITFFSDKIKLTNFIRTKNNMYRYNKNKSPYNPPYKCLTIKFTIEWNGDLSDILSEKFECDNFKIIKQGTTSFIITAKFNEITGDSCHCEGQTGHLKYSCYFDGLLSYMAICQTHPNHTKKSLQKKRHARIIREKLLRQRKISEGKDRMEFMLKIFKNFQAELLSLTNNNNGYWKENKSTHYTQFDQQVFTTKIENNNYTFTFTQKSSLSEGNKDFYVVSDNDNKFYISPDTCKELYPDFLELCNALKSAIYANIRRQNEDKIKSNPAKEINVIKTTKTVTISYNDFIVRTNIYSCLSSNHNLEEVTGIINVLTVDGNIVQEKVTAAFCKECGCYFLMMSEYERVSKKGRLLCNMIEKEEFYKSGLTFPHLSGESILMRNGYNVKASVGLSDIQRQTILANLMDQKVLVASQILSYLSMFIAQKRNMPSYKKAVSKWEADMEFVRLYKENNKKRIFVNSITKTTYKINKE